MLTGAGHFRRLIEISKAFPESFEKYFFGSVEISWAREMVNDYFARMDSGLASESSDIVILDSYEEGFCQQVRSEFADCHIIQIADRYTFLLPDTKLIFMDLPFSYRDSSIASRVLAHGIKYLPIRRFCKNIVDFSDYARRVLVTTGGLINHSIFSQLIEELNKRDYKEITFEFIGKYRYLKSNQSNLRFHDFGTSFDSIANNCDSAISASGTTLWDLLANQKIVGIAAAAENQRANFDFATQNKQALRVFDSDTLELDIDALRSLLFDSTIRKSLRKEISGKYDFSGANRVACVILNESNSNI